MSAPVQVGPSPSGGGPVPFPDWDETLADIGDRIRAERQARGWSETKLGQQAGIGRNTVRRLEHGDASLRCFVQACTALGVSMEGLLSPAWQGPGLQPVRSGAGGPVRRVLSPRQAEVLAEAASGDSLAQVGARIGMDPRAVGGWLSRVYQRLGVAHLPKDERRAAAVQVAMRHGLFDIQKRTS